MFKDLDIIWDDSVKSRPRFKPPIPETGWACPKEFPNLASAKVVSIDTETFDPELTESGPGWARKRGHIVGFSLAAKSASGEIGSWYWPLRHQVCPQDNHPDSEKCFKWLKAQLSSNLPKVGANLIYDLGWLEEEGVTVNGPLYDIQHAEALLDERARVNLETVAQKYLNEGKESNLLYQWCAEYYEGPVSPKQRANIYRAPPSLVGHYAESDASLPIRILEKQWPLLADKQLLEVFDLECRLIRPLIKMRQEGVSVDLSKAEKLHADLIQETDKLTDKLTRQVGFAINVDSANDIARVFDAEKIPYRKTEKGAPSFTAPFLESVNHPLAQTIVDIRQRQKLAGTFLESYIFKNQINGKIYGSFNQLRGEAGGARSGRFSSSLPNLQNIPQRTALGKKIRQIFVPDKGHDQWRVYDYSQVEYRLLAHFAVGEGADKIRARYNASPETDYHDETAELIKTIAGMEFDRSHIKTINFALIYGMAKNTLISRLGLTKTKGDQLYSAYHSGVPFAQKTMQAATNFAEYHGFVTTVMGRRSYFDRFESANWHERDGKLYTKERAERLFYEIVRAETHKALNRILQGSAADVMKKAVVDCHESGVFTETGYPRLTVHDELDFSDSGGKDKAFHDMQKIMEGCITLRIPLLVEGGAGPNWGDAK